MVPEIVEGEVVGKEVTDAPAAPPQDERYPLIRLTPNQDNFAIAIVETNDIADSYAAAYRIKKANGEELTRAECAVRGHQVLRNPKVQRRIQQLKAPVIVAAKCSYSSHLLELAYIRDRAMKAGNYGEARKCEESRGVVAGHYIGKRGNRQDGDYDVPPEVGVSSAVMRLPTPFGDQESWAVAVRVDVAKRANGKDKE